MSYLKQYAHKGKHRGTFAEKFQVWWWNMKHAPNFFVVQYALA